VWVSKASIALLLSVFTIAATLVATTSAANAAESPNYDWADLVLTDGGWPTSSNNVTVLTEWMTAEKKGSGKVDQE
jgi:hypothetical protein